MTIGRSGLILVVTGSPGTASVIAQAIDESTLSEQEGTLAGDNTLLVLFADERRCSNAGASGSTADPVSIRPPEGSRP